MTGTEVEFRQKAHLFRVAPCCQEHPTVVYSNTRSYGGLALVLHYVTGIGAFPCITGIGACPRYMTLDLNSVQAESTRLATRVSLGQIVDPTRSYFIF